MSEGYESSIQDSAAPSVSGAAAAGALLRAAREAAGVHVGALAVALKVPVRKLDALESGQLEGVAEPVFVRALASSVCRHLKIDPAEVLALLPQSTVSPLSQPQGLRSPFQAPATNTRMSGTRQWLTPPVLVVLALLFGAAVLLLWPEKAEVAANVEPVAVSPSVPAPQPATAAGPANAAPVQTVREASESSSGTAPAASAGVPAVAAAASAAATAIGNASVRASEPVASLPPVGTVIQAGASAARTPANGTVLQFRTRGESWIEVSDASGATVFRRTLAKGEAAEVAGTLPLRVVIGRADVTDVQVRGRAFDLSTVAKENVARFEVNP